MANNNSRNYITNMVKQFGENWIVALKPDDIQRAGKRIAKEMVKGYFNYEEVGVYFLDAKFMDNLIISIRNELEINTLYYNAVSFYAQYNINIPNAATEINHLSALCYIYNIILGKLIAVKDSGNIGYLADTSAMLYSYRNHLN